MLVVARKYCVEVVVVHDALVIELGVVEAVAVFVFDFGIDRWQYPLGSGVNETELVVIDIDNEFVGME